MRTKKLKKALRYFSKYEHYPTRKHSETEHSERGFKVGLLRPITSSCLPLLPRVEDKERSKSL